MILEAVGLQAAWFCTQMKPTRAFAARSGIRAPTLHVERPTQAFTILILAPFANQLLRHTQPGTALLPFAVAFALFSGLVCFIIKASSLLSLSFEGRLRYKLRLFRDRKRQQVKTHMSVLKDVLKGPVKRPGAIGCNLEAPDLFGDADKCSTVCTQSLHNRRKACTIDTRA